MSHYRSNGHPADAKGAQRIAEAAARIGDGKHLTPADFAQLNVAERTALFQGHRETYDALVEGRTPGAPWTPTTTGRERMAQADL